MKITISDKKLDHKPTNMGRFFGKEGTPNRIQFKTGNYSWTDLDTFISNGYTLAYQCKGDDAMNRKDNYIGTDFIVIDVDSTDLTMDGLVSRTVYKPTIIHTSFSNLTAAKNNKYCYHLIYCFDETLYGKENFYRAFAHFSKGIEELVDQNAKDCNRVTFTSNSNLPYYECRLLGTIYSVPSIGDVNNEYSESTNDFSNDNKDNVVSAGGTATIVSNSMNEIMVDYKINDSIVVQNATSSLYKISGDNLEEEAPNCAVTENIFQLDHQFYTALYSMSRKNFIAQYSSIYQYQTFTEPTIIEETPEGIVYADYRWVDYYELPSYWRINKEGKSERIKVEKGRRTWQMYIDTNIFLHIIPDITKEHLVYEVVRDIYENYDNSDKQFNNGYILASVKNSWKNKDKTTIPPIPKKFKILKYPDGYSKQACVGIVRRLLNDDTIGSVIDFNLSLEENLEEMKKMGIPIQMRRLKKFIKENRLVDYIKTDRHIRDEHIRSIVTDNPNASLRQIEHLCKEQGITVSPNTIRKVKSLL